MKSVISFLLILVSLHLFAQVTLDGIKSPGEYPGAIGNPLAIQTVETEFGDQNGMSNGSELDGMYFYSDNTNLYLFLSGNLEANLNRVELFLDAIPGGQNTLAPPFANINGGNFLNHVGFSFDTGFEPDFFISVAHALGLLYLDFAKIGDATSGESIVLVAATGAVANGTTVFFNNSNLAGVLGGTGPSNAMAAAAVNTGFEFKIPLSVLGVIPGNSIKVMALINNPYNNFVSNQFLPGLPPNTANLGGDGIGNFTGNLAGINLNNFAGNQFVSLSLLPEVVVPTLGQWGIIVLGLLVLIVGFVIGAQSKLKPAKSSVRK